MLKRTPLSGGWGSGKLGDITMDPAIALELGIKAPPRIYVECKNREGVLDESFWRYLATGTPATIGDWIGDTCEKAKKLKQTPFLILKGRGTEPFVFALDVDELLRPVFSPMGVTGKAWFPVQTDGKRVLANQQISFFPLSALPRVYGAATIAELKG